MPDILNDDPVAYAAGVQDVMAGIPSTLRSTTKHDRPSGLSTNLPSVSAARPA